MATGSDAFQEKNRMNRYQWITRIRLQCMVAATLLCLSAPALAYVTTGLDASGYAAFKDNSGRLFRFVGANVNELHFADENVMNVDLDYMQRIGIKVIRVWGVDSNMNSATMAARLKVLLDKAQARGLYVVIALTHNYRQANWVWNAYTGQGTVHAVPRDAFPNDFTTDPRGFYSRSCAPHWCLSDSWIDWGHTAYYKSYAIDLVSRLKTHQAIFAWDLANELSVSRADATLFGFLRNFYVNMARAIKTADPNHLVTTGTISLQWSGFSQAQQNEIRTYIDYYTVHEYVDNAGKSSDFGQDNDISRANVPPAGQPRKPVVVEEFGSLTNKYITEDYYNRRFLNGDPNKRVTGIMYWGVSSYKFMSDGLHWWPDPESNPATSAFRNWAGSYFLAWGNWLNGKPAVRFPGCGRLAPGTTLPNMQVFYSCNGQYFLNMQPDGNLVIYRAGVGATWQSHRYGRGPSSLSVQGDGNVVTYQFTGRASWWTGTNGKAIAGLYMQDDGNLVIYSPSGQPLWASSWHP
jgi:hypothetical protein